MLTSACTRGKLVSVFGIRLGTPYRSVAKTFVLTADMLVSFGHCEILMRILLLPDETVHQCTLQNGSVT